MHDMAAIEFGRDLDSQPQAAPGIFHRVPLGDGAHEISTQADERTDFAFEDAFARLSHVDALLRRRLNL